MTILTGTFDDIYRALVFFSGDVRRLHAFPWFTWSKHERAVTHREVLRALPFIEYGDIGLHRDWGYLSNVAIPGYMKHSWIHVQDGSVEPEIVEAIGEGVVRRSPIYPMHSDYTIILTPSADACVTEDERKGACLKAKQIVGRDYDHRFEFDIEAELDFYQGRHLDEAREHLAKGSTWLQEYHHAFSCTEAVSYAWWHRRESLGICRTRRFGKSVILADTFLNRGWKIKWASQSVTVDDARKRGLGDEGLSLIEDYLRERQSGSSA